MIAPSHHPPPPSMHAKRAAEASLHTQTPYKSPATMKATQTPSFFLEATIACRTHTVTHPHRRWERQVTAVAPLDHTITHTLKHTA